MVQSVVQTSELAATSLRQIIARIDAQLAASASTALAPAEQEEPGQEGRPSVAFRRREIRALVLALARDQEALLEQQQSRPRRPITIEVRRWAPSVLMD